MCLMTACCMLKVYNVKKKHALDLSNWFISMNFFCLFLYTHVQLQTVQMRLVTFVDIGPN